MFIATTSQEHIEKFLRELVEHLAVFVPLVQQEFQPMCVVPIINPDKELKV
jgi:hypothetical protein